jgi:hypothetical protein
MPTLKTDKIINPKTGRLVLKTSALGKKILKEMNDLKNLKDLKETKKKKEVKPKIKEGYENINGKIYKICKEGQVRNPKTNRCIKKKEEIKKFINEMKYPLNHEFNKKNVKKFLEACDDATRPLAKKIIDNTMHISFEKMIKYLNMNIQDLITFIKKDRPIFIYADLLFKQNTNTWMYLYFKNYIEYKYPDKEIIVIGDKTLYNDKLRDGDTIVFIEDCIYNGMIFGGDINSLKNSKNLKLNIFILSTFVSNEGMELIKTIDKFKIIFNHHKILIPNINDYLTKNELELLNKYYLYTDMLNSDENETQIFESFNDKYLIYFDHKLADGFSTIPLFYSGIVPNTHNKKIYNNIIFEKEKKLQIIPLLKNCEHVRNRNSYEPKCPSQPYNKYKNDEFLKKLKKIRNKKQISNPNPISNKNKIIQRSDPNLRMKFKEKPELTLREKLKKMGRFTTLMNYPLNYEFNKSNVKKFLEACEDDIRPLAKKIIDNTMHISFEKMIKYLNMNIKDLNNFIKKDRPIFLFIKSYYKEKSNNWLYLYFKDYIEYKYPNREIILLNNDNITSKNQKKKGMISSTMNYLLSMIFKNDNDKELKDNDTIIFIDDCVYTGQQMYENITNLNNDKKLKLNIFILASFISKEGEELLRSIKKFKIFFNSHLNYIPHINDYLTEKETNLMSFYYTNINIKNLPNYDYNNFERFTDKYLIYFDHKLADGVSTIPLFYSGVVPNINNIRVLSNSTKTQMQENLEIIPLFKNCEKIRNISTDEPQCPSTPYKKISNEKFMKKIKKLNEKRKPLSNPNLIKINPNKKKKFKSL